MTPDRFYPRLVSLIVAGVSSANSPTLPTYEQCNEHTLPPSFDETLAAYPEEEAVPPYTPPEPGTPACEENPSDSRNATAQQNPDQYPADLNHSHLDTQSNSIPNGLPPPYA